MLRIFGFLWLLTAALPSWVAVAGTLDDVRARGALRCGVSEGIPGFSERTGADEWRGLDIDLCRAVTVAVLGQDGKMVPVPLNAKTRFAALKQGQVDVLIRNTTWTLGREVEHDFAFAGINYFDGQGFLTRQKEGLRSAIQLSKPLICVKAGTEAQFHAERYFQRLGVTARFVVADDFDGLRKGFAEGKCDVVSADQSQLHGLRPLLRGTVVLPEFITKEPLGPVVRADDPAWFKIVKLTLALLVNAEELGIDSGNVVRVAKVAESESVRGTLDLDGYFEGRLRLSPHWARNVIEQIGNYGESFHRNLGRGSVLHIGRGQNALWSDGGLLYAPPMR